MKFLFDLFPVILFFAAYKLADIYVATGVAIAATVGQIAWLKLRRKKIDAMMWVTLVIIVVFGGATLFLHDESFIKWKPTVLYWLFALILGGAALTGRNLIRKLMGAQVELPDPVWTRLNWSWAAFFAVMGFINLYVARGFPTETWVNFKLFGSMGLMLVFVIGQAVYLSRHVQEPGEERPEPERKPVP